MNTQDRHFNQLIEAGRAVVERRLQLGMSQAALASAAGIDAKTLRSLERGERWPQDTSRVKVERALGWQDGTLHALLIGDFLWRELDNEDGTRTGGIIFLRAPAESPLAPSAPTLDESPHLDPVTEDAASTLTASELAALLVTKSQVLERRVRQLERERNELRSQLDSMPAQKEQEHDDNDPARLGSDAQRNGVTAAGPDRIRDIGSHPSGPQPRLLDDDGVNDDILELPYAADDSEDPGEDDE